jgi:hypothetical protein
MNNMTEQGCVISVLSVESLPERIGGLKMKHPICAIRGTPKQPGGLWRKSPLLKMSRESATRAF